MLVFWVFWGVVSACCVCVFSLFFLLGALLLLYGFSQRTKRMLKENRMREMSTPLIFGYSAAECFLLSRFFIFSLLHLRGLCDLYL